MNICFYIYEFMVVIYITLYVLMYLYICMCICFSMYEWMYVHDCITFLFSLSIKCLSILKKNFFKFDPLYSCIQLLVLFILCFKLTVQKQPLYVVNLIYLINC